MTLKWYFKTVPISLALIVEKLSDDSSSVRKTLHRKANKTKAPTSDHGNAKVQERRSGARGRKGPENSTAKIQGLYRVD
ncbi:hypothetical protein HYFRA_00008254 [Hymenoscyphus fraxineus]|uniref:Uncharacterized protein n=1 Tax=Hymenoscyphus fraxineus TaxID=746836 RepID=A0A9N9L7I9_9HELO|nr:hypothetical protein HYFRA_00008254 [Hymenoscyphus fraxineus]